MCEVCNIDVLLPADLALSQKLAEELQYEKEASTDAEPDFLKDFKQSGIWTVCYLATMTCPQLCDFQCQVANIPFRRLRMWLAMMRLLSTASLAMKSEDAFLCACRKIELMVDARF